MRQLRGLRVQGVSTKSRLLVTASAPRPPEARHVDVLGAGFAGVAVTYFLLSQAATRGTALSVRLLDAKGIGGGASGVAAGLLNPFSARGDVPLWRGVEGCAATERLLEVAEKALGSPVSCTAGSLHPHKKKHAAAPSSSAAAGSSCEKLSAQEAAKHLPGLLLPLTTPGVDFYARGRVVNAQAYLDGLWAACQDVERDAQGRVSVELVQHRVSSLQQLADGGAEDVVVCAGAAATLLPELAHLPLTTSGGHIVVLAPQSPDAQHLASHAPALMLPSSGYVAPTGDGTIVIGATKVYGVHPNDSFGAGTVPLSDAGAAAAADALLPPARTCLPPLADYTVRAIKWGVRALPPRTQLGALPLVGQVTESERAARTWVFAGLGARGLVYHALLAEELAHAVLTRDAVGLPQECSPGKPG